VGGSLAFVLLLAGGLSAGVVGARGSDPEVSLPDRGVLPAGARLSDEDRTTLRQQVDPDRLRCVPRGCERWRHEGAEISQVVVVDGLMLLLEEDRLVALDGWTGAERWVAPLGDLISVTGDGTPITSLHLGAPVMRATSAGILLATERDVVLVDLDGQRRWGVAAPPQVIWDATFTSDRILLTGSPLPETERLMETERLVALDLADGATVWERPVQGTVWSVGTTVVLVSDGPRTLAAIDPSDGRKVWEVEREPDDDLWGVSDHGRWVGIASSSGQRLLDPATGVEVGRLEGQIVSPIQEMGERFITIVTGSPDPAEDLPPWAELIALDRDGRTVWRVPFESANAWHWMPSIVEDGGVITASLPDERLRVDLTDGTIIERTALPPGQGPDGILVEGVELRYRPQSLELERDGHQVRVLATDAWIVSWDPTVVGGRGGQLLGLRLDAEG
jgi:hypothetical protein